jgi:uncharacterized membrane protein (UPF0127 family)
MRTISLSTADGRCIARQVRVADSFFARSLGLLRDRSMSEQQGLLLIPGGSVHTIGMRFPIDVVFLDRRMCVLDVAPHVAPQRFCLAPPRTARVLELAAGRIAAVGLLIGTYLIVPHESDPVDESDARPRLHAPPSTPCVRPPIQFSLRLPPQRCARVQSNLGCAADRVNLRSASIRTARP